MEKRLKMQRFAMKKVLLYQELFEYFNYERKYVKKAVFQKKFGKIKSQGQILKKTQKSHIINCKTNSQVRFLPSCRERTKIRILAWRWRRQAG